MKGKSVKAKEKGNTSSSRWGPNEMQKGRERTALQ
jgi:hypothetical protein